MFAVAEQLPLAPIHGLNARSLAVWLHILLMTYWLGADLGVFYSSRFVTNEALKPEARAVAAKVMHAVDMAPRICLVLILPSGVTLMATDSLGRDIFGGWPLIAIWVAAFCWLALVVMDYRHQPLRFAPLIHRLDIIVRVALVVGLFGVSLYTMIAADPFGVTTNPKWLGGKVAAYSLCILAGLLIRVRLAPFAPAFGRLMSSGSTPEVERAIRGAVRGCLPFVYAIWVLVALAAFLGVVKPGSTAYG